MVTYKSLLISGLFASLLSCAAPEVKFAWQAKAYGFSQNIVQGPHFKHRVYSNALVQDRTGSLHIYLGGDGSPWIGHRWIATNPTPRNTLILKLMQQDNQAALFLGRPCYHGLIADTSCTNALWTSQRYASEVISAMATAINKLTKQYQTEQLVLIGFSGGGTIAALLTEHLSNIDGIVTIAANLDVTAWTEYHSYSPLSASLNPIQRQPIANNIWQLHLAGGKDKNIPTQQIKAFVDKQFAAELLVFADFDHHCCWTEIWPGILQSIQAYQ
ncbi:MAG: alpha/beta hydrolase [Methyloprofundus sp.]|nr:alpha/beta hydrolase [Methyloprofundus sp.]